MLPPLESLLRLGVALLPLRLLEPPRLGVALLPPLGLGVGDTRAGVRLLGAVGEAPRSQVLREGVRAGLLSSIPLPFLSLVPLLGVVAVPRDGVAVVPLDGVAVVPRDGVVVERPPPLSMRLGVPPPKVFLPGFGLNKEACRGVPPPIPPPLGGATGGLLPLFKSPPPAQPPPVFQGFM